MLAIIACVGFVAVRRKMVSDDGLSALTRLLTDVIVPSQMIVAMAGGLDAETLAESGVIILAMVAITLASLAWGLAITRAWQPRNGVRSASFERTIISLSGFQNGVYLPLPLMLAITPPEQHVRATVLVGGAFIVLASIQWTLGVFMLRGETESAAARRSLKGALLAPLNPPVVSILIGVGLAFVPPAANAARGLPAPALLAIPFDALALMGQALGPLASMVLGMMIGRCNLRSNLSVRAVSIPMTVRFLIAPLMMLWALTWGPLAWVAPLAATTLMIQASSPPATNLSLIARRYGGDWQLVSSVQLITYATALFILPAWTALIMARGS